MGPSISGNSEKAVLVPLVLRNYLDFCLTATKWLIPASLLQSISSGRQRPTLHGTMLFSASGKVSSSRYRGLVYMCSDMQRCELAHILECQHTAFKAKGAEGQLSASVDG